MKKLGDNKHSIQAFKDPFKTSKIVSITLKYSEEIFEDYFSWQASIRFRNGDTRGSQDFKVSDKESNNAFEAISKKVQDFVGNLE